MCHNSQSVAFHEHLLGPMSPGCLLECGAGRLAGRWKSAAGSHSQRALSPSGHVPLIARCDRRSLAVKKLRAPALASAPAVSGFPKLCCRRLHRARRQFFLIIGQAHVCCLHQYVGCGGRVPYWISASRRLLRIAWYVCHQVKRGGNSVRGRRSHDLATRMKRREQSK